MRRPARQLALGLAPVLPRPWRERASTYAAVLKLRRDGHRVYRTATPQHHALDGRRVHTNVLKLAAMYAKPK